ncbi:MAG: hypothetical protein IPM12_06730 [Flavobacteriales bacterium]|nr:hypothetical protein [Flavobacteriales bacterium]
MVNALDCTGMHRVLFTGSCPWHTFTFMNRPILPALLLILSVPLQSAAQQAAVVLPNAPAWRLTSLNFGTGVETDRYETMSLQQLMAFAKSGSELQRDLSLFEERVSTTTSGLGLFVLAGFSRPKTMPTTTGTTSEVQVGVGLHSPREAMVTYRHQGMDTSIVYCNLQTELSLETAYLLRGQWSRYVHWHAGLGANGSTTVNNRLILIEGRYLADGEHPSEQEAGEMNKHSVGAKRAYFTRIFIPSGVKFRIGPRWQLGMDYRLGIGWQFVPGHSVNRIAFAGAGIIGARYAFH